MNQYTTAVLIRFMASLLFLSNPIVANANFENKSVFPHSLSEECKAFLSTTLVNTHWQGGFLWVPADWKNPAPQSIYDLVVIGGGTAGLVSAAGTTGLGGKVALVERHLLGGDAERRHRTDHEHGAR